MNTLKRIIALIVLLLTPAAAYAGSGDGTVKGVTKIVDSGPASSRFNLVLISDGYTEAQLPAFAENAQQFVDFLFKTPPFNTNCSAINVYRIDVTSSDSGADDPTTCDGGTGDSKATYFDSTFCSDGKIRRLLGANSGTATTVLNAQVPEWDQALIIVNSSTYGGSGGTIGVTSVSGTWQNIAIHEFGHSAFGLADEYEYWSGCGSGEAGHDNHPAAEPVEPNVTVETDTNLVKWRSLFFAGIALPTTTNADCSQCDSSGDPYSGEQRVGLYEGAHYYHCDAYRPVFSCMMRDFSPFCPVCTKRILDTLQPFQPANTAPVCVANGPYTAECAGAQTSLALSAEGSKDKDCDTLAYLWTGGFAGGSSTTKNPNVTFYGLGSFPVSLKVSDDVSSSTCGSSVTIKDTTSPVVDAPADVAVECSSPAGATATLGTASASDICDSTLAIGNNAPAVFPIGTTNVLWTATDDSGNSSSDTQTVTVKDTVPPVLTVTLTPATLWSPNHRMVEITAAVSATDVCDAAPVVRLVSITSNQPDNSTGDGSTTGDISGASVGTDDRSFALRAERQGSDDRVYTVKYEARDAQGNATVEERTVTVPGSQGK